MNETKTLLRSSITYFFGYILSKIIVFFMLPLYTTYITPEDYGYYDLTINYVTIFTSVLFLDIWSGVMRFMYDWDDQQNKLKTIYSALPIYGSSLVLYLIIFSIFNVALSIKYFPLALLYGAVTTLSSLYSHIIRSYGKSVYFACSGLIGTIITVLLNIVLIIGFEKAYWSLYVASLAGLLLQIIMLELKVRLIPNFSVRLIDRTLLRQLFRYSLPLFFNSVAYCFLTSFSRVVIVGVLGEAQNGYFAIASKFSILINLIGTCFLMAWQETSFRKEGEESCNGAYYSKGADLYVKFICMGTICMLPAIGIVFPYLVNSSYASAKAMIPLSLFGTSASLLCAFTGSIFSAMKQTRIISVSSLLASLVSVVTLLLLVKPFGVQAANISFLLAYLVNCAIRVLQLNKMNGFHLSIKPFIIIVPLFAAATFIFMNRGFIANMIAFLLFGISTLFMFKDLLKLLFKKAKRRDCDSLVGTGNICGEINAMASKITIEELRKIELDILIQFTAFCEENQLRYYLTAGTLLGAIKYRGFIPWDDDIDVSMPRPDYEKLLRISSGKISDEIDILSHQNTPSHIYPFAKAINNRTELVEDGIGRAHPLGVYIDIFPIDGVHQDVKKAARLFRKRDLFRTLHWLSLQRIDIGRSKVRIFIKAMLHPVCKACGYRYFTEVIDKLAKKYNFEESENVSLISWGYKESLIPKNEYLKPIQLEFEGRIFNAPSNYHQILEGNYGDYSKQPSPDNCVSHHKFQAYWK